MRALSPAFLSAILFIATLLNLCDLIFQCGCHSWFTGAASHCNIHQLNSRHCPWCTMPQPVFWSTIALITVAQTLAARTRHHPLTQFAVAQATAYALVAVWAIVLGWLTGYWT